jgi:hypothetical protein
MAKDGNWKPGEKIPRTGTYKCIYCGPNGMGATMLKHIAKDMGIPYTPSSTAQAKPPFRFFKEGDTFPSCPNCVNDPSGANPTGWDFVSEKEVKGESGCFIATACFECPDAPEVIALRRYRDTYLMDNPIGRISIWIYNIISPYIASFIQKNPGVQKMVRDTIVTPLAMWARVYIKENRESNKTVEQDH